MPALDEDKYIKDVEINIKFLIVKVLHVNWLIEMHNQMTPFEVRHVYLKGWKVSAIFDAVKKGLNGTTNLDLFMILIPSSK